VWIKEVGVIYNLPPGHLQKGVYPHDVVVEEGKFPGAIGKSILFSRKCFTLGEALLVCSADLAADQDI